MCREVARHWPIAEPSQECRQYAGAATVDAVDLEVIISSYLTPPAALWRTGDMNADAMVSWTDISLWMDNRTIGTGGDFDDSGDVGVSDIDNLFTAIDIASYFYGHYVVGDNQDLNGDGNIDDADMDCLIHDIIGTDYGDANLDGLVDQLDVDIVNLYWQQEVDSWAKGDFNGDGFVDVADLLIVALNFGFVAS